MKWILSRRLNFAGLGQQRLKNERNVAVHFSFTIENDRSAQANLSKIAQMHRPLGSRCQTIEQIRWTTRRVSSLCETRRVSSLTVLEQTSARNLFEIAHPFHCAGCDTACESRQTTSENSDIGGEIRLLPPEHHDRIK